jgi:hypothetical protein
MAKPTPKMSPSNPAEAALLLRDLPTAVAAAILQAVPGHAETEQAIGTKMRSDQIRALGMYLKAIHAQRLTAQLAQRTLETYDRYAQLQQAMLDQPRDARLQADLESFATRVKRAEGESLIALDVAATDSLQTIALEPLNPPVPARPRKMITQKPGFFGQLFGGTEITTWEEG